MIFFMSEEKEFEIFPLHQKPELAAACAAWSYGEWGSQMSADSLDNTLARYRANAANTNDLPLTWIALRKGKIAGMARLKEQDHPVRTELTPWLASVFVHPEHRGRGIAKALCKRVAAEAKNQGFRQIYLFTHTAPDMYAAMGWEEVERMPDLAGLNPAGDLLMVKKL